MPPSSGFLNLEPNRLCRDLAHWQAQRRPASGIVEEEEILPPRTPLDAHPDAAALGHEATQTHLLLIHSRAAGHESPANIGSAFGILPLL